MGNKAAPIGNSIESVGFGVSFAKERRHAGFTLYDLLKALHYYSAY